MNPKQQTAITNLQNELLNQRGVNTPLPDLGASNEGYEFTEVQGVTVCIGPDGGYILPAVRSYKNSLQAAVDADNAFKKNRAGSHKSGHDVGIVGTDWRCGSPSCDCQNETPDQRFARGVITGRRSS
jgi:hypothetical protein